MQESKMVEDVDGALIETPKTVESRDAYVVETASLAPLVRGFRDQWHRERPPLVEGRPEGGFQRPTNASMNPFAWLEEETTKLGSPVNRATIRTIAGAITPGGIRKKPFTPFRDADAIVTAIGQPWVFYDGTLRVTTVAARVLTGDGATR